MNWTRTKIIATLGPATAGTDVLERLARSGVDVFRLNFSHGSHDEHAASIRKIRSLEKRLGVCLGVLQDLPGPKIRLGSLPKEGVVLNAGERVFLGPPGSAPRENALPLSHPRILKNLRPGHSVYLVDGTLRLKVLRKEGDGVLCLVQTGGRVRSNGGVNFPDTHLNLPAFTAADARHMAFGLAHGVDFVGLSFVGGAGDVERARRYARSRGKNPLLIAKIERRQALKNLRDIVKAADGLMVARGDLGVEMPFATIPGLQQDIVRETRREGKPVIVATQVLESMVEHPRPTRAEATDIAHAVWSGADAVMLSGETSVGKYPVEAVRALNKVLKASERRLPSHGEADGTAATETRAFVREAMRLAQAVRASAVAVPVRTGRTVRLLSAERSKLPLLALTPGDSERRALSLYWGVRAISLGRALPAYAPVDFLRRTLRATRLLKPGCRVMLLRAKTNLPEDSATLEIITL